MASTKPILFNTEMVRAILAGRKTQTRRVIKPKYREDEAGFQVITYAYSGKFVRVEYYDEYEEVTRTMPMPCDPGDILWVRETWNYGEGEYRYKADDVMPDGWHTTAWRPSIHMPKEAARIFLRVKDVRAERLQEITAAECLREGIEPEAKNHVGQEFAQGMFHDLWDSTVKPADRDIYGWAANPWVWVIEFELCEKPEGWEG